MFGILTGCNPSSDDKWFFTKIFDFESITIDQNITNIYLIDETTGLLFGTDLNKIVLEGLSPNDQSILFFRSSDGGRTFEKHILGKGILEFFSRSADNNSLYIVRSEYSRKDSLGVPDQYQILKSSDSGRSWNNLSLFENKVLAEVLFYDDNVGFASVIEEPIGYDVRTLYKTTDGGITWKPTFVNIDDIVMINIGHDRKIIGQYLDDDDLAVWKMDIDSLQIERIDLQISSDFSIYGLIETDILTNEHYLVLESQNNYSYTLYNIEREEFIEIPDYTYVVNIYGNFIGTLSNHKGRSQKSIYSYSTDRGKKWIKETPPDSWMQGMPSMYGTGYLWVMTVGDSDLKYPLMVRIAPIEKK